jgi:hypothetical protein
VIGDPAEIARPQARKTAYLGTLQDGKTRGFWAVLWRPPSVGGRSPATGSPTRPKPSPPAGMRATGTICGPLPG